MTIWSINHWNEGDDEVHLCACISLFMEYEMSISMTMRQALLFRNTPEYEMMKEAAEKNMHAIHATRKPTVAPPPPCRTMHLSGDEIKVLEEYRKYNTYLASKRYTDLKYLHK